MRTSPALGLMLVGVLILPGLVGCGGGANLPELQAYIDEVMRRPAPPIEPIPQIRQIENFIYIGRDRRDPFVMDQQSVDAIIADREDGGIAPDPTRPREVLENYDLDSLRMMGTIELELDDARWALIRSPDRVLHRVTTGNYLGRDHGRIIFVGNQGIELIEIINTGDGVWQERDASIALKQ